MERLHFRLHLQRDTCLMFLYLFLRLSALAAGLVSALSFAAAPRADDARERVLAVGAPGKVTFLAGETRWQRGSTVSVLGPLIVPAGARLDIEAGVTVEAAAGASIVVERNARLSVTGTLNQPVVLTCPNDDRTPGCWDGLAVLGHAPVNHGTLTSPAGGRGGTGGCRESTLDGSLYGGCATDDSSGVIRFLRVQYAANGLRLFGVGSKTVVSNVQVHRSVTNGVEVVGGAVRLRHIALTTNAQYGLVYSGGWTGQAQYVVIQQDAAGYAGGILGRNAQGAGGDPLASAPLTAPTLANLTIVTPRSAAANPYISASPAALRFDRGGGAAAMYNVLLIEPGIAVDVDEPATCTRAATGAWLRGVGVTAPTALADPDADPAECAPNVEATLLAGATIVTGTQAYSQLQSSQDAALPDLRPRPGSVIALASGVAPPATGILEGVTYLGAVAPAASTGAIPWYSGWTIGEQLAAGASQPTLAVTVVASGLSSPWDIAFLPDGAMLFTENRRGLSLRSSDGTITRLFGTGGSAVVAPDLTWDGQSGVLGVTVDPQFASNRRVYMFMTSSLTTPRTNRVIRLVLAPDGRSVTARTDIITDIAFKSVGNSHGGPGQHSGGRLRFGLDGLLYVTTGDNHNGVIPQSPTVLGGKVLRVTTDGAAAPGNNAPSGFDARIYTYGHRNVQGIDFRPGSGVPYVAEHGPGHSDEVTALRAAGNAGWDPKDRPALSCPDGYCGYAGNSSTMPMTDTQRFPDALQPAWSNNGASQGMGPAAFLVGAQWGAWNGRLAVGIMGGIGRVDILTLNTAGAVTGTTSLGLPSARYRALTQGPDGNLYFATDAGEIWRVSPTP